MIKTAESVKRGHPDKICDQISDAILDECLKYDKNSRVAIETLGGHGIITVTGELTTKADFIDIRSIVKRVYWDICHADDIGIQINVVKQSPDISQGVDIGGAGDQGIMVGYACNENKDMIPNELWYARYVTNSLEQLEDNEIKSDGKAQVTMEDEKIIRLVISNQTEDEEYLTDKIKAEILPHLPLAKDCKVFINPTGKFRMGGFEADTGLTGRKIVVDSYGPRVPVGGGAFSGKDPSKVDRSAAYMARKVAVDYLKKYKCAEVLVKIAYSIGKAEPMMAVAILTDKNGVKKEINVTGYDLTPNGIIKFLKLREQPYYPTAQHGHFGNNFIWDK